MQDHHFLSRLARHGRALAVLGGVLVALLGGYSAQALEGIELPDIGDSAGAVISPEQEKELGLQTMRELRRHAPLIQDEEVEDYIRKLGMELGKNSGYYGDFNFCVIKSDVINAFAVPGGYVCFHSGLILNSHSENEVASVMAHEISHLTQRHGARMFEAASNMSIPSMAAFLGAILLTAIAPQAGIGAIAGAAAAQQQYQIDFTRENEKEADRIGIELLNKSGFRTAAMADFFDRMQSANRYSDPRMIPEFLRTHPVTTNRIAEARERAEQMPGNVVREDSFEYHLIWHKLNVMGMQDPNTARNWYEATMRERNYANESAARYGYVLALIEVRDFPKARAELAKLLAESPKLTAYRLVEARLEQESGNTGLALDLLAKLHKADPESRAATYTYVNLLLEEGEGEEARRVLRASGKADEREPKFYKLLAQAEKTMGHRADSHYNLAEYYRSIGELELAAEQLRLAQVLPELTHYQRLRVDARLDEIEKDLNRLDRDRAKRIEREERRRGG